MLLNPVKRSGWERYGSVRASSGPNRGKERLYVVMLGVQRAIWLVVTVLVRPRGIGCLSDHSFREKEGTLGINAEEKTAKRKDSGHLLAL